MGQLDDIQRTILGGLGAMLAVTASPIRSLVGLAFMVIALHKPR